jgi:hypothetical protein
MASGPLWTWSCESCSTMGCSIVAPTNQFATPPALACSGTVRIALSTSPQGIGDGPGDYPTIASCVWEVSAREPITIRFSQFLTGTNDFVELFDGASTSARPLGLFSGSALPSAVTSTGGALMVRFLANVAQHESSVRQGFSYVGFSATLTVASIEAAKTLVGTVPAMLGDLRCIGNVTSLFVRSSHTFAVHSTRPPSNSALLQGSERPEFHRPDP